jgi:hypothetical protein
VNWPFDAIVLSQLQVAVGVVALAITFAIGAVALRIAKSQKDMQEEQHRFFVEQRDNKPALELWVTGMRTTGPETTSLTISVRNWGKAAARGFAWEIVAPFQVQDFVSFRAGDGSRTQVRVTVDFARSERVNFFIKDTHLGPLFVGDMVDVAVVNVSRSEFQPFQLQWRIYADYGTVPKTGHNTIWVGPRPQGLLDVRPVLTIPAVTP